MEQTTRKLYKWKQVASLVVALLLIEFPAFNEPYDAETVAISPEAKVDVTFSINAASPPVIQQNC